MLCHRILDRHSLKICYEYVVNLNRLVITCIGACIPCELHIYPSVPQSGQRYSKVRCLVWNGDVGRGHLRLSSSVIVIAIMPGCILICGCFSLECLAKTTVNSSSFSSVLSLIMVTLKHCRLLWLPNSFRN